ncbi:MAG TPA: glycosyltransferase family 39 protein [Bacteroidia bacterium]|nr:glycosyltransferase family 39 protein [Bacteroidia bacterium]
MLVAASLLIGFLFATLDPFLQLWDEQFHALVSKNLLKHWWKPTLYENPILTYDYKRWGSNHIWLHKQPLFMWQMALSEYFFGNTEIGVRFPDVVLHALLTFIIFDLGRLIKNERVGFLAALFFTFLLFPLELISGNIGLDHNDFDFMFYITASFWAYFRYRENERILWLTLIGLFAGCAVLIKWLPGLLVYLCWFTIYVYDQRTLKNIFIKSKPIVISALTAFIVFLPWQVYCYINYPIEFKQEMLYNSLHITTALQGHGGDWTFYFTDISKLYGEGDLVPYILLISFLFFVYDKKQSIHNKIIITTAISVIYLFFTIVQTKMTGFVAVVLPLVIIVFANFITEVLELIKNKTIYKLVFSIVVLTITFLFFDLNMVLKRHSLTYKPDNDKKGRLENIVQTQKLKELSDLISNKNIVLFNCDNLYIKTMYYCENVTAYGFVPSIVECETIKNKGYKIAVLRNKILPDYIENDKSILKINF